MNSQSGGDFVLKRLTEVLFVQMVRGWSNETATTLNRAFSLRSQTVTSAAA